MTASLHRPPDAQTVACPCRHGDVPAEIAGQRPLLARAVAGDREAFAELYDAQVEGVYRYLLAWTGDRSAARELTGQVFRGALAWLPVTAGGEGDVGAWLIAMARDAVAQGRGSGWMGQERPGSVVDAVARLGDPEREVVVLRLLLGHSLSHTAHPVRLQPAGGAGAPARRLPGRLGAHRRAGTAAPVARRVARRIGYPLPGSSSGALGAGRSTSPAVTRRWPTPSPWPPRCGWPSPGTWTPPTTASWSASGRS